MAIKQCLIVLEKVVERPCTASVRKLFKNTLSSPLFEDSPPFFPILLIDLRGAQPQLLLPLSASHIVCLLQRTTHHAIVRSRPFCGHDGLSSVTLSLQLLRLFPATIGVPAICPHPRRGLRAWHNNNHVSPISATGRSHWNRLLRRGH